MGILYERILDQNQLQHLEQAGAKLEDDLVSSELLTSWAEVMCFPMSTQNVFHRSNLPLFHDYELLLGISNHKLTLPGTPKKWNNDLFVLGKCTHEFVSIMVTEATSKTFGESLKEWFGPSPTDGQIERLAFLASKLNKKSTELESLPIHFLNTMTCAILEAERFATKHAVVLVHSFLQDPSLEYELFEKYSKITQAFGIPAKKDRLIGPVQARGIDIYFGWVTERG